MFSCARIFFITAVVLHIINDGPRDFHKEIASRSSAHVYNNLAMLSHLIPHSPALRRHVNRHTKDSLLAIIEAWFADPETTPPQPELDDEDDESEEGPATFDAYEPIKGNKKRIVERLERDWKDDDDQRISIHLFTPLQITSSIPRSAPPSILPNSSPSSPTSFLLSSNMCVHLTLQIASSRHFLFVLLTYRPSLHSQHVHIAPDPENSTIWIRIVVHDGVAPTALPPAGNVVYLVHFPNSEYLLCGGSIKAEIKAYVVQVGMVIAGPPPRLPRHGPRRAGPTGQADSDALSVATAPRLAGPLESVPARPGRCQSTRLSWQAEAYQVRGGNQREGGDIRTRRGEGQDRTRGEGGRRGEACGGGGEIWVECG
ncbi:hypothetical protein BC936DRAFT_143504 [Jimgerdemannia flammicorona]|uniref:Uncharacterized protein n=1 Tax=Jimgerdemannia flammicorona TaxID=994334 RepID=A0A432ZYW5_9FUNG|nr:hypothetical protein BC936DRAFT_143504 [Jimgerdemannia flammicorona]